LSIVCCERTIGGWILGQRLIIHSNEVGERHFRGWGLIRCRQCCKRAQLCDIVSRLVIKSHKSTIIKRCSTDWSESTFLVCPCLKTSLKWCQCLHQNSYLGRETLIYSRYQLGCAFRFRYEAKRSENEAKNFSLRSEKNAVFSLVSLRSEKLEIISETKTNEAKRKRTEKCKLKKCRRRTYTVPTSGNA
jgi:hypothetical protein